jgi:uncharacterized integral membrane protein
MFGSSIIVSVIIIIIIIIIIIMQNLGSTVQFNFVCSPLPFWHALL